MKEKKPFTDKLVSPPFDCGTIKGMRVLVHDIGGGFDIVSALFCRIMEVTDA
jgi:hypothetical protein